MDSPNAYQDTLDYLYAQLPMFTRIGSAAIKKDLTNTIKFCEHLDNPQNKFKSIHIAGSNGKGSVSHMLAAILQEAGYKTGLYTSPHLVDFRERIRINGQMVAEEWVVDFVAKNKEKIEEVSPSFFEITVAMAFEAFAEEEVDIAIIETGLGGRLDSTNVITPVLSVITNISLEHTDLLGDTPEKIAFEKAGIIKQGVPTVIGEQQEETEQVFFIQGLQKQSTLYYADAVWDLVRTGHTVTSQRFKAVHRARREMHDFSTDLMGSYQVQNIKTVLTAVDVLTASQHINLPLDVVLHALSHVKHLTGLRGRWEILHKKPLVIADSAHNPAGIAEVMKQWSIVEAKQKHIITGFVKDKDVASALKSFPKDAKYYFSNAKIPRALPVADLKIIAAEAGLEGTAYEDIGDAVKAAIAHMDSDDALLITGSFFVIGEALGYIDEAGNNLFTTSLEEHV